VELVPYSEADLALTRALESDPEVMSELGGPHDEAEIASAHRRRVATVETGGWWLKILPEPSGPAAGAIGIWETQWEGSRIHEVGWMVLPAFQGRGVATAALALLIARARSDPRFERIHAFPGVTNGPSNALCRKFGFSNRGECDVVYAGRPLRCNHWELELRSG
jgi:RimJ/RimL family protein N-acetyltransferase